MSQRDQRLWNDGPADALLRLYPTPIHQGRGGILLLPGGGYGRLAEHEGARTAEFLSAAGFDVGLLRYRLGPVHRHPAMIHDAARGMRMMRASQAIRAEKIAVMGFSAGGHLASTLAVHPHRFANPRDDLAQRHEARPDAAVLCYPVIDMSGTFAHANSRNNLLGEGPDRETLALLDTHRHVDENTPPTFLWHTHEDQNVKLENSLMFARACRAAGVPFELHLYERGGHGLGRAEGLPEVHTWLDLMMLFLDRHLRGG